MQNNVLRIWRKRVRLRKFEATLAQLVEHTLRKGGVPSSILGGGSSDIIIV